MIHYELVLRKIQTEGGVELSRKEITAGFSEQQLRQANYDLPGETVYTLFADMRAEEEDS